MVGSTTVSPSTCVAGIDHGWDVEYASLEEVAGPLRMILDEAHRVTRLDVLGENEDADLRMLGPDGLRGYEAFRPSSAGCGV
jgi:hypothetical protein